jgi:hypothetical protein
MTQLPTMISDAVLSVGNNENTAMVTPLSSPIQPSTSPLDSQCQDPFWPMAWRTLTSVMRRPQRWQVNLLMPLTKTVKIPLRFHHPTTTAMSSPASSQKDLASDQLSLPKGWVYVPKEVSAEVKAKVVNPSLYQSTDTLLTQVAPSTLPS